MRLNCVMRQFWTLLALVTALVLGSSPRQAAACPAPVAGAREGFQATVAKTGNPVEQSAASRGPVTADTASRAASGDDGGDGGSERGSSDASMVAATGFDSPPSDLTFVHAPYASSPYARPTSPAQRPPRS